MSENAIFPGDKIASIEEYEAGHNAFDDGDMARAATVGERNIDKESRTVNVNHPKLLSIPKVGDIIIGTVAAAAITEASSMHIGTSYFFPLITNPGAIPIGRWFTPTTFSII